MPSEIFLSKIFRLALKSVWNRLTRQMRYNA